MNFDFNWIRLPSHTHRDTETQRHTHCDLNLLKAQLNPSHWTTSLDSPKQLFLVIILWVVLNRIMTASNKKKLKKTILKIPCNSLQMQSSHHSDFHCSPASSLHIRLLPEVTYLFRNFKKGTLFNMN